MATTIFFISLLHIGQLFIVCTFRLCWNLPVTPKDDVYDLMVVPPFFIALFNIDLVYFMRFFIFSSDNLFAEVLGLTFIANSISSA